jgi:hypothetical protein
LQYSRAENEEEQADDGLRKGREITDNVAVGEEVAARNSLSSCNHETSRFWFQLEPAYSLAAIPSIIVQASNVISHDCLKDGNFPIILLSACIAPGSS